MLLAPAKRAKLATAAFLRSALELQRVLTGSSGCNPIFINPSRKGGGMSFIRFLEHSMASSAATSATSVTRQW